MDYKKIITGLLSKAHKLDDGKVAELLKDGEDGITEDAIITALLEIDSARVAKLKNSADTTGKFQEGYAKAKKEEREAFEKEIRERFKIESDAKGVDLIDEIVTVSTEGVKGKKGEVTEDDVKKHPVYQNLEGRYKKDIKAKDEEWQSKLTEVETKYKAENTFGTVKNKALAVLDGLKPVLPGTPEVAANQKQWFITALKDYEYDLQDDRVVVMKDGKVVEDGHGNSIGFDELVKTSAAKFFEFQQNNGGANAGNNNDGGQGGSGGGAAYPTGVKKPTNMDELSAVLNDTNIKLADRQKIAEVYEAENSGK